MTLGERCDEIVRLIDETLGDIAVGDAGDVHRPSDVEKPRTPLLVSERLSRFGISRLEEPASVLGVA